MLLVTIPYRRCVSVGRDQVPTPWVPDTRHAGLDRAREFLGRFEQDDFWFRSALTEEVSGSTAGLPTGAGARELIDAAAQAIATGTVLVATPMPARWSVYFDRYRPRSARINVVGIPNLSAALGVVRTILADRRSARALEQALHHAAAERGLRAAAPQAVARLLGKPVPERPTWPPDFGVTAEQIARMFRAYWLVLRPGDMEGHRFNLAWAHHSAGGVDVTEAGPADPAPRPRVRPDAPEGPRSQLPVPTRTPSPQADALVAAALAGSPFCEECMRQEAAARSHA